MTVSHVGRNVQGRLISAYKKRFQFSKNLSVEPIKNTRINTYIRRSSTTKQNSFQYCTELVRKHDYENYLCTLLLPNSIRNSAFIIRAFNVEIALVKDLVSKPDIGYMRLQFWKDTIEKVFEGCPPSQPVALELAKVLEQSKLSKSWFLRLISSREETMTDKGFLTIEELESYCEKSVAPIYYLILQSLGINDVQCDHVASHIAKSQGIANVLRSVIVESSKGRVRLPLQTMSKHKIRQEDLLRGRFPDNMPDAVLDIATVAHQHLTMARSLKENVTKQARLVFLPAVPISSFLKSLEKTNFDILDKKHQRRNQLLPFLLWFYKIRSTY